MPTTGCMGQRGDERCTAVRLVLILLSNRKRLCCAASFSDETDISFLGLSFDTIFLSCDLLAKRSTGAYAFTQTDQSDRLSSIA